MGAIIFDRTAKVVVTIQHNKFGEIVYEFSGEDGPLTFSVRNEFKDAQWESGMYPEIEPTGFVTIEVRGKPKPAHPDMVVYCPFCGEPEHPDACRPIELRQSRALSELRANS
jgi:hypothetical protein